MNNIQYRYPGVTPFTPEQKDLFFGRDADIENLYNLVNAQNQVLLYSKSGIGKSSLINAGLIPRLQKRNDIKFYSIRLHAHTENSTSPTDRVREVLNKNSANSSILDKIIPNENSLWYILKNQQLENFETNKDITTLIIFDQFEELFSYPPELVFEFKKQISDLLYSVLPVTFRNVIKVKEKKNPDFLSVEETMLLNKQLNVKILFSIRYDRYTLLHQLTDRLPDITRNYYELKSLSGNTLQQAITNPAQKAGQFATHDFKFSAEALKQITDFLTKESTQEVESTQLQIICRRCEDIISAKKQKENLTLETADIPNFDDIFLEFYNQTLDEISGTERTKAQIFIEEELVKKAQRISLDKIICLDFITEQTLEILTNKHLLRSVKNTTGGFSYELSHDTLIEPVTSSKDKRHLEEKRIAEEIKRKKDEEEREFQRQAELKKLQEQRKRSRTIIAIVTVAAVISVAFGIFGFVQMKIANKKTEEVNQALLNLDKANKEKLIKNYEFYMEKGKAAFLVDNYIEAIANYDIAKSFIDSSEVQDAILTTETVGATAIQWDSLMTLAETNKNKGEDFWCDALQIYKEALNTSYHFEETKELKQELESSISARISSYSASIIQFEKAGLINQIPTVKAKIERLSCK